MNKSISSEEISRDSNELTRSSESVDNSPRMGVSDIDTYLDKLPLKLKLCLDLGYGLMALNEGLITVDNVKDAAENNPDALKVLFSKYGYNALKGTKTSQNIEKLNNTGTITKISFNFENIQPVITVAEVLAADAIELENIKDRAMANTFGPVIRVGDEARLDKSVSDSDEDSFDDAVPPTDKDAFTLKLDELKKHAESMRTLKDFEEKNPLYKFVMAKHIGKTIAKRTAILKLCGELSHDKASRTDKLEEILANDNHDALQNRGLGFYRFKRHGFVNNIGERTHRSNSHAEDILLEMSKLT